MPEALRGKYQYSTCATIDRLRATGYDRPVTPLADAVTDYVANYLVPARSLDPSDAPVASPLPAPALEELMSQPTRADRRRDQRGGAAPPPHRDPMTFVYIGVGIAVALVIVIFGG